MTTVAADNLRTVQRVRKAVLFAMILAAIAVIFVTGSIGGETDFHQNLEFAGLGAIAIAIVGRAWCSLYIGGRKKAEIVDRGPYSISRNPLYVFSFFGAFGIGAQTGSVTIAVAFVLIAWTVFRATVKKEEAWLANAFGAPYAAYLARVPRFWPNFSLWRDRETLEVKPAFFLITIRDGLAFLLAIPIFEGIEHLQDIGWLRVVLQLP